MSTDLNPPGTPSSPTSPTAKPSKPPLMSVKGKRAYAKLGGLTPAMFGSTVFEMHKERVIEITRGPVLARDCHVSIAEVDSAEVVTCGNPLFLVLGFLTLALFGLGLLFFVLYFVLKHKFLVLHSSSNIMAMAIKGDPSQFHEFKSNVIKLTNHYKLNR